MGSRQARKVIDKAQPFLDRGERVEMVAFATIGSVNLGKEVVGAVAVGAAVAIATGGDILSHAAATQGVPCLHDRTLMFFDGQTLFGRPGNLLFTLPRQAVHVAKSGKFGLGLLKLNCPLRSFQPEVAGQGPGMSRIEDARAGGSG